MHPFCFISTRVGRISQLLLHCQIHQSKSRNQKAFSPSARSCLRNPHILHWPRVAIFIGKIWYVFTMTSEGCCRSDRDCRGTRKEGGAEGTLLRVLHASVASCTAMRSVEGAPLILVSTRKLTHTYAYLSDRVPKRKLLTISTVLRLRTPRAARTAPQVRFTSVIRTLTWPRNSVTPSRSSARRRPGTSAARASSP